MNQLEDGKIENQETNVKEENQLEEKKEDKKEEGDKKEEEEEIDPDAGRPEYEALVEKVERDLNEERNKELSLLKTINVIYSSLQNLTKDSSNSQSMDENQTIVFKDFYESIQNDSIPKFVMLFFHISSIDGVEISDNSNSRKITERQIQNINAVIEYLAKKENKFKLLRLSYENFERCECSAILFYSNFLNFFFLKKSKKEMYDRCKTLFTATKDEFIGLENFQDLSKYIIYIQLVNFVLYRKFDNKLKEYQISDKLAIQLFEKAGIPLVLEKDIFNTIISRKLPYCLFYQLRFIFDCIDAHPEKYKIIELLRIGLEIFKSIKVPNYNALKVSIESKNKSKKYQIKKTKTYKEKGEKRMKKTQSSALIQIPKFSLDEPPEQTKKTPEVTNIVIQPPKTYKERKNFLQTDNLEENENEDEQKIEIEIDSFNSFWKSPNTVYKYDHGLIYDELKTKENQELSEEDWTREIKEIQKHIDKKASDDTENTKNIIGKAKLYKLLYYDEKQNKWCFDNENFYKFANERFKNDKSKTPFILFLDSNEIDTLYIAASLINSKKPNIEEIADQLENEIYIYAIYEHSFSQLVFSDFSEFDMSAIKPLFLFLHVPLEQFQNNNLTNIIIQAYSFLSMICDFEVVILEKKTLYDQMSSIKLINDIANSYYTIEKKKAKSQDEENLNKSFQITYKKTRMVFLLNDPEINYSLQFDRLIKKSLFFNNVTNIDERKSFVHFIKIDDFSTYGPFIDSMAEICAESNKYYTINNIASNFIYIEKWDNSDFFINLMTKKQNWKSVLKKTIRKRYEELTKNENSIKINISALTLLGLEIDAIAPPFANDFIKECYNVLSSLRREVSKNNRRSIKDELNLSSQSNLNYLDMHINKYTFLTPQQMSNIMESHAQFLEKEFFSIIQDVNTDRIYDIVFEDNIDILKAQIDKDNIVLDQKFKTFVDKINKKKETTKKNIQEGMEQGVNYAMRERENLKEIKIIIQSEDELKDLIPQDF